MTPTDYTIAVIATADRPDVCRDAIDSLHGQVDLIYVIDNGDRQPMPTDREHAWAHWYVRRYEDERPINLSKVWNRGLDFAYLEGEGRERFNVIIANDDAVFPEGWASAVSEQMREFNAAAGCSGPHDVVLRQPGPVPLAMRMQGWAFMLAGEKDLRFDERFQWWFGDDDMDWRARQAGGMSMKAGYPVQNRFANQSTNGERAAMTAQDGKRFMAKWGRRPW